jgi:hypothetical protein
MQCLQHKPIGRAAAFGLLAAIAQTTFCKHGISFAGLAGLRRKTSRTSSFILLMPRQYTSKCSHKEGILMFSQDKLARKCPRQNLPRTPSSESLIALFNIFTNIWNKRFQPRVNSLHTLAPQKIGFNPDGSIVQVKMKAVSGATDFDFHDLLLKPVSQKTP